MTLRSDAVQSRPPLSWSPIRVSKNNSSDHFGASARICVSNSCREETNLMKHSRKIVLECLSRKWGSFVKIAPEQKGMKMKTVGSKKMVMLLAVAMLFVSSVTSTIIQADVYTGARSAVGSLTVPPLRAEARFQPNETATLWSWNSGFGPLNGCTVHSGTESTVQSNGGVWCRSLYKGFWSDWAYIRYQLLGSGNTFYSSSAAVRTQCTLYHPADTTITVCEGAFSKNGVVVDVRGGRNSLFDNLLDKRYGLSLLWETGGTGQTGQVTYAVPYTNVYAMVSKNNWNYIAPITSAGSSVTINMPTSSHTVTVKKRGVLATGWQFVTLHEAFFNQTALPYQYFQAHPALLTTNGSGTVQTWPQPGMPVRFVAFDNITGNGYAVGPITPPGTGSTKLLILAENEPTLSTPSDNASIPETSPVPFSWGIASGASGYYLYLWDVNSSWSDVYNAGTNRSVGAYFYPGEYAWRIRSYDSSGDLMTESPLRFFTVTSESPSPAPNNFGEEFVDQFDAFVGASMLFADVDWFTFFTMDWFINEYPTGVIEFDGPMSNDVAVRKTKLLENFRQQIDNQVGRPVIQLMNNIQIEPPVLQRFEGDFILSESGDE